MYHGIVIIEDNLDTIQFLNDGVRPLIEEMPTVFIYQIEDSVVIKSDIVSLEAIHGRSIQELLA